MGLDENSQKREQIKQSIIDGDTDIRGNLNIGIINQAQNNITNNYWSIPKSNSLYAKYRESFKPLIEKRLTLFGGRNLELDRITKFIEQQSSSYLIITAPAGFGKTSLIAKFISEAQENFGYHFFAPYENPNSVTEEGFLKNIVEQMAQWQGYTETRRENLDDLRSLYQKLLDEPLENVHVLIIDGLDEVTSWNIAPYLRYRLPKNLHIIITVRDVGQDWVADYDLPKNQIEHLPLRGLTRDDVADVLRKAGRQATVFADNVAFLDEIMKISAYQEEPSLGADPFYVRFLAEDAADGRLTSDNIVNQPKGLKKYLSKWWQKIEESEENNEPLEDLFGTLAVALGRISRTDLETINPSLSSKKKRNFFYKIIDQVRRWIVGDDVKGYTLAHPRLRDYICTEIYTDELLEGYEEKLLTFCTSWQKHQSLYALRYYPEHLRDAKLYDDLYEIVRNNVFAEIQLEKLPDEPDLPLKTIQTALLSAAKEDNAGLMAEFILRHTQSVEQKKLEESPLEAIRKGSLQRALKLVEIYEVERQILWYLLLAWELQDTNKMDEARTILEFLQQKQLPRYQMKYVYWQGDYVAYFLARLFETSNNICFSLQEKILDDNYRRNLCKYLCELNNFSSAINITLSCNSDIQKIRFLTGIAKEQANMEDEEAKATFEQALEITRKPFHKTFWLSEIIMIGKAQVEAGYIEEAKVTLNEVYKIAQTITNQSEQEYILKELENLQVLLQSHENYTQLKIGIDKIFSIQKNESDHYQNSELKSGRTENLVIEMIKLEKAGRFAEACTIKDKIKDKINSEDDLCQTALAFADKKCYGTAIEFATKIQEIDRRAKIQGLIAISQAEADQISESRANFAIALQGTEESANAFLYARTLIYISILLVKVQKYQSGVFIAQIVNNQVKDFHNLRHKAIILSQVAEVLFLAGNKNEAKTVFDNAEDIAQRISIQQESSDCFRAIALSKARVKYFTDSIRIINRIEFPWTKIDALKVIVRLQTADNQFQEPLTVISKTLENLPFSVHNEEVSLLCIKAVIIACTDKVTARTNFEELIELVRESGKQKDENLSTIVAAIAETGEISTALQMLNEIEDNFELVKALLAITWKQFKKGDKITTFAIAIEAKNRIKDENKLVQSLKMIAQIQALSGEGQYAVKTVESIVSNRSWHFPGIASLMVDTGDKVNFKRLLIPCAYYLDAAYEMCGYLARLYPEQIEIVAKVVTEFN